MACPATDWGVPALPVHFADSNHDPMQQRRSVRVAGLKRLNL